MRLPDAIEREIRAIEADYDNRPGQHAGPSRLRGLRAAVEAELAALRTRHAEAVEKAWKEAFRCDGDTFSTEAEIDAAWQRSWAHKRLEGTHG